MKKQYFYNRLVCKKVAFLQKYIFVKKQYFYIKITLFYKDRFFMQHENVHIRIKELFSASSVHLLLFIAKKKLRRWKREFNKVWNNLPWEP